MTQTNTKLSKLSASQQHVPTIINDILNIRTDALQIDIEIASSWCEYLYQKYRTYDFDLQDYMHTIFLLKYIDDTNANWDLKSKLFEILANDNLSYFDLFETAFPTENAGSNSEYKKHINEVLTFLSDKNKKYTQLVQRLEKKKFAGLKEITDQVKTIRKNINAIKHVTRKDLQRILNILDATYKDITDNKHIEAIIIFLIKFPFINSLSIAEKKHWIYTIAKLVHHSTSVDFKKQIYENMLSYISGENPRANLQHTLDLLDILNDCLTPEQKLHFTNLLHKKSLSLRRLNRETTEQLFDLKYAFNDYKHLNKQCNAFLNRYFKTSSSRFTANILTPQALNHLWCSDKSTIQPEIIKLLACTNFLSARTILTNADITEIKTAIDKIRLLSQSNTSQQEMRTLDDVTPQFNEMEKIVHDIMDLVYMATPSFNEPLPCSFKIQGLVQAQESEYSIIYCELYGSMFFSGEHFVWFDPMLPQGEIRIGYNQASTLAKHLLQSCDTNSKTHGLCNNDYWGRQLIRVTQYSQPTLIPDPILERSLTPAFDITRNDKFVTKKESGMRRIKTMPNLLI